MQVASGYDLTVKEEDIREYVVCGSWKQGRERTNPSRDKEEQIRKGMGRRASFSDPEPLHELSCLYNSEKIYIMKA